jgi:hypothetical protein
MRSPVWGRAAPAGNGRDPQVDRLLRAINTSNSTPSVIAATTACHAHGCPRVEATHFGLDSYDLLTIDAVAAAYERSEVAA